MSNIKDWEETEHDAIRNRYAMWAGRIAGMLTDQELSYFLCLLDEDKDDNFFDHINLINSLRNPSEYGPGSEEQD